jgi:hypothetical protein
MRRGVLRPLVLYCTVPPMVDGLPMAVQMAVVPMGYQWHSNDSVLQSYINRCSWVTHICKNVQYTSASLVPVPVRWTNTYSSTGINIGHRETTEYIRNSLLAKSLLYDTELVSSARQLINRCPQIRMDAQHNAIFIRCTPYSGWPRD